MRAVVVAPGIRLEAVEAGIHTNLLLPVMDRPVIQHVVEELVEAGARHFDFILSVLPHEIERLLGDGSRWGCHFRYHLAPDPDAAYQLLRLMHLDIDPGLVWLARGNAIPLRLKDHVSTLLREQRTVAFASAVRRSSSEGHSAWSGWALIPGPELARLPCESHQAFCDALLSTACSVGRTVEIPMLPAIHGYGDLLPVHGLLFAEDARDLRTSGRQTAPGVRVGIQVHIDSRAEIVPPAFIGSGTRVGPHVQVGPFAVVGAECVLSQGTLVTDALILPGTYVGPGMNLRNVVVDHGHLVSPWLSASVDLYDEMLLTGLAGSTMQRMIVRWISRVLVAILMLVTAPLAGMMALLRKASGQQTYAETRVLRLPTTSSPDHWNTWAVRSLTGCDDRALATSATPTLRHFLYRVIPALPQVVAGHCDLVGTPLRRPADVKNLPLHWRRLYLGTPGGLITEEFVRYRARAVEVERFAADAFYASMAGRWRYDMRLLCAYFMNLVTEIFTFRSSAGRVGSESGVEA